MQGSRSSFPEISCFPLYVDAKSVFAAVTATFLKTPAEKSLLSHVQFLREFLDHPVIHSIHWIDTRDMHADGLTKGAVSRDLLHEVMDGPCIFRHDDASWRPRIVTPLSTRENRTVEPSAANDFINLSDHFTESNNIMHVWFVDVAEG